MEETGWGHSPFHGLKETLFSFPTGPNYEYLNDCNTTGKIFDIMWSGISSHILDYTLSREMEMECNINDINLLLASQLVMGLTPQPSIVDYFKHDDTGIFGSLWMQQHFTREKWKYLNSNIHFQPRVTIQMLRSNVQMLWNLDQILIVDEMMVPFTGRWKWIQFVKGKPHDTGLKFYGLTDFNFYLWDFWLYEGSESERSGKPTDIVMDFATNVTKIQHKPHIIVADSYYGSLNLAQQLHNMKLGCLFSCRADKPTDLFTGYLHNGLTKGNFNHINNRTFSAITYYDKAKVNLLTNVFLGNRMIYDSTKQKSLPISLYWYRKWLGGLDHFDRWLHLYLKPHRNIKWTQALLPALLKIAVGNTNIIANRMELSENLKDTTLQLIQHLTSNHTLRTNENRPIYQIKKTGWGHFPEEISKKRPCAHCLSLKVKSSTTFKCQICDVALHPKCFKNYHES